MRGTGALEQFWPRTTSESHHKLHMVTIAFIGEQAKFGKFLQIGPQFNVWKCKRQWGLPNTYVIVKFLESFKK